MTTTVKTYTRRDSCTAVLRTLGIKPQEYDFFIDKQGDQFMCRTDKALRHLEQLKELAGAPKLDAKSGEMKKLLDKAAEPKPAKEPRVTVSSRARDLIRDGQTNEEVWAVLQAEFNLDDSKKHYPGWYRAAMARAGLIK